MRNTKNQLFFIILLLVIILLSLSGCGAVIPFFKNKEPERVSNLPPSAVFIDSKAIRAQFISLLKEAEEAIFIELAALDDPEIVNLLVERSRAGVEVKILLDQWQRENTSTVKYLKNQNISVQYYPTQKGQYQRVRYLVVDYKKALFLGQDLLKKLSQTHSLAFKLTGKTAWNIAKSFAKDWEYTTTLALSLPNNIELAEDNITFALNQNVKQQILNAIAKASSTIEVEVEKISEYETVQALIAAKQKGCEVRIIVNSSCAEATPNTIATLKEAGIEVRYYQSSPEKSLYLNIGIFDQKTIVMSCSSWSYNSFVINHEGSLTIPSPQVVKKIYSVFEQDWKAATPA
ncbi:MAG: phospholipase D-like domain-containing protein [Desulfitobacteriia bacterium]